MKANLFPRFLGISVDLLLVFSIREYVISVNFRVTYSCILFSIWVYLLPVFTFRKMLSLFSRVLLTFWVAWYVAAKSIHEDQPFPVLFWDLNWSPHGFFPFTWSWLFFLYNIMFSYYQSAWVVRWGSFSIVLWLKPRWVFYYLQ